MPYLHFTIGPVQGFVSQARRTRDFWAGSFLLSFLSGQAIWAAQKAGGEILRPSVQNDPLYLAISEGRTTGPIIGTLTNNFRADFPGKSHAEVGEIAKVVEGAVQGRWQAIATAVWDAYLENLLSADPDQYRQTKAIWDAQVKEFWEISWIVTDEADPPGLPPALAMRKFWRGYSPPAQRGDKCTVMGTWQELSGRVRAKGKQEREAQDSFWEAIRELGYRNSSRQINPQGVKVGLLNLEDSERLCAIAFIKRFYPVLNDRLIGLNKPSLIGWRLGVRNWPSTSYMAAVDWLEEALKHQPEAEAFENSIEALENKLRFPYREPTDVEQDGTRGEAFTLARFPRILKAVEGAPRLKSLAQLEGSFFFDSFYADPELPWKEGVGESERKKLVSDAREALKTWTNKAGTPSPYYAFVAMDADLAGKLLDELRHVTGDKDSASNKFSEGLAEFAGGVPAIVTEHGGVTVYAGGEDVLALLPLSTALAATAELRTQYQRVFADKGVQGASISGGVTLAHYRLAMRGVISYAHEHVLDTVAKERNGRNSLAVTALNRGGPLWEWVSTWDTAGADGASEAAIQSGLVTQLVEAQVGLKINQDAQFSTRFYYKVRERYGQLMDVEVVGADEELLKALLVAEYMKTAEVGRVEAEQRVGELLGVCRSRTYDPQNKRVSALNRFQADGAIMVRFLASKGVGR